MFQPDDFFAPPAPPQKPQEQPQQPQQRKEKSADKAQNKSKEGEFCTPRANDDPISTEAIYPCQADFRGPSANGMPTDTATLRKNRRVRRMLRNLVSTDALNGAHPTPPAQDPQPVYGKKDAKTKSKDGRKIAGQSSKGSPSGSSTGSNTSGYVLLIVVVLLLFCTLIFTAVVVLHLYALLTFIPALLPPENCKTAR
ncbi:unnamed protein product [Haemonchus placei]|uniref:Uncharacterized protein n=1 Tax=Haemonchus placei TaxID=6290 RepID=A0A0N4WBY6_HAEPC|nr:unnamed protein product [Haemonchus placei]